MLAERNSELKELERDIYKTYYERNPKGDARTNGLWKDVIDAKKEEDQIAALELILENIEDYDD